VGSVLAAASAYRPRAGWTNSRRRAFVRYPVTLLGRAKL
jgi:hypothetical protein